MAVVRNLSPRKTSRISPVIRNTTLLSEVLPSKGSYSQLKSFILDLLINWQVHVNKPAMPVMAWISSIKILKLALFRDHSTPSGELPCLPMSKWYSQLRMSRAQFQCLDLLFRTALFAFWLKNKVKKYQATLAIRTSDFIFSPESPCHLRITRYIPSQKQGQTYCLGGHLLVRRKVIWGAQE